MRYDRNVSRKERKVKAKVAKEEYMFCDLHFLSLRPLHELDFIRALFRNLVAHRETGLVS